MNTYYKFAPNVFLAKCDEKHEKGEEITVTTKYGKENESIVFNLIFERDGFYYYSIVRADGFNVQEWANMKLIAQMKHRIVRFYFRKVDGTIREAYGTLKESMLPPTQGTGRKANETLQTYYDTERQEYRSFKRANLVEVCS